MDESNLLHDAAKPGSIYAYLSEHQRREDWEYRDSAASLLSWAKVFNREFKLQVTEVVLKIGDLSIHRYSQFRRGHNELGLRGEITINPRHFGRRPFGLILGDLLHELLHCWQHEYGRPPEKEGWHNREYRRKAAEATELAATRSLRPKGESKLKKWICSCPRPVNVRVAISDFQAMCLVCQTRFRLADSLPSPDDEVDSV